MSKDTETVPEQGARHDEPRGHWYDADIAWVGSGRDGDPWVKVSWTPTHCTCDRPWRH